DLSELDEATQIKRIEEAFANQRSSVFDPAADSPLRILLLSLSPDRHLLSLSLPALCADVQSLRNLTREIVDNYAGSGSAEPPMQYADFAEWQNELLEGEEAQVGRAYWRDYWSNVTEDALVDLNLPFEQGSTGAFLPASLRLSVGSQILTKV